MSFSHKDPSLSSFSSNSSSLLASSQSHFRHTSPPSPVSPYSPPGEYNNKISSPLDKVDSPRGDLVQSTVTPPPQSPFLSDRGPLLEKIRFFLENHCLDGQDKAIKISESNYQSFVEELQDPKVLSGEEAERLRYDYNPEKSLLTLRCMPSYVHDTVGGLASMLRDDMMFSGFLSYNEYKCIFINQGANVPLPSQVPASCQRSKGPAPAAVKQPDAAYYFIPRSNLKSGGEAFPRVVFEVAFTRTYETAKDAAEQWLIRSAGRVKLVIVINLVECKPKKKSDAKHKGKRGGTDGDAGGGAGGVRGGTEGTREYEGDMGEVSGGSADVQVELQDRVGDVHGASAAEVGPSPSYSSQFSTASGYETFQSEGDHAPWVGPISGFAELYRYNEEKKSADIEGSRINIFQQHDSPIEASLKIKITDLLPDNWIEGDRDRRYSISFGEYSELVEGAVRKLALERKASNNKNLGKRKFSHDSDDNSGEYLPDRPRSRSRRGEVAEEHEMALGERPKRAKKARLNS